MNLKGDSKKMNKFVFIDHITMMPKDKRSTNSEWLSKLKKIASDRNIHITLLSREEARKSNDKVKGLITIPK